jgi:hypothetical protein
MPSGKPLPERWTAIGAVSGCVIGAIAGLVVGLFAYPPTALFAIFELGIPATIAGGAVGFVAAVVVAAARWIMGGDTPTP